MFKYPQGSLPFQVDLISLHENVPLLQHVSPPVIPVFAEMLPIPSRIRLVIT